MMIALTGVKSDEIRVPYGEAGHYIWFATFQESDIISEWLQIRVSRWSSCDVSARFELLHACQLKKLTLILRRSSRRCSCVMRLWTNDGGMRRLSANASRSS